ncbi:hypothetical protein OHA21_46685 [Actinoplanes sp. NBC_00393]|uniref:hypothetical protein n=1 Tax=Actinoplanes sp. NBC_00393 TaxID=2975953 RepID=UPI002E1AA707
MHTYQWPTYPPADYHQYGPDAAIAVTMKYSRLGFLLGLFTPVLVVDGQPVPAHWRQPIVTPVVSGQHHVHAHVPYLLPRRIGRADLVVTAVPGQTVELEYRAPLVVFMRGALGAGPQKYPGLALSIVLMVFTLLLALCSIGGTLAMNRYAAVSLGTLPSDSARPIPELPGLPPSAPALPNLPEPEAEQPARRLTGATFEAGDETLTMRFQDWPFTFRTPPTWDCLGARTDLPDATAYICTDGGKRLAVMLRACAAPCGAAQMKTLTGNWFRAGEKPRRFDATTKYLEASNRSRYQLVMSHFFAEDRGDQPQWQVALDATAPAKDRADVQKIVNDILSRTS